MHDPPPVLGPGELPTPAALAKLAREILGEQAKYDPELAEKMRAKGLKTQTAFRPGPQRRPR